MRTIISLILIIFGAEYVWTQSSIPKLVIPEGHKQSVNDLVISQSGNMMLSGSSDGTCKLWDLRSGMEIMTINHHEGNIYAVCLAKNERFAISGGQDNQIVIWDIQTGDSIRKLEGHIEPIKSLTTIQDDKYLVSASLGGVIKIWNIQTGKCLQTLLDHKDPINTLAVSHDEKRIISAGGLELIGVGDNAIRIWDIQSGKLQDRLIGHRKPVNSVVINENGTMIASGDSDNTVFLWDVQSGEPVDSFYFQEPVTTVLFGPNEENLIVGLLDKIKLIRLEDGSLIQEYKPVDALITKVVNSHDYAFLFAAQDEGNISRWKYEEPHRVTSFAGATRPTYEVACSSDGGNLATTGVNQPIQIWDMRSGQLLQILQPPEEFVIHNHVRFLKGHQLISSHFGISGKSKILVWDVKMNRIIKSFQWEGSLINDFDLSDDLLYLAACGENQVMVWDYQTGAIVKKIQGEQTGVMTVDFSPNGRKLLSGATDQTLFIWDLEEDTKQLLFGHKKRVMIARFGPSGKYVVAAGGEIHNAELIIWDFETETILKRVSPKHQQFINSMAIAPNGDVLTGSFDGTIYLMNLHNDKQPVFIGAHEQLLTSVGFDPSLQYLFSSSTDQSVKIWLRGSNSTTPLFTLFNIDGNEWLILKDDFHYSCSKELSRKLGFRIKNQVHPFEQYDLIFNRPDLIAESMLNKDDRIVQAYRKAFHKRLQKMNFTESMLNSSFHVPTINVTESPSSPQWKTPTYDIHIGARDDKLFLDRINIFINDVPIFGRNGINLRNRMIQEFDSTLTIFLSPNMNKIQVSALNQGGAESLKATTYITYDAPEAKPNLYLITIGVSDYQASGKDLQYAAKDAQDIADFYANTTGFKQVHKRTLTNSEATKANILALRDFLEQSQVDDQVLIYVSGHGLLDENYDFYYATHDIDFADPSDKGILYDDIEDLLDGIPARKKLLLMDACHSGEYDADTQPLTQAQQDSLKAKGIAYKGFSKSGDETPPVLGLQNSFEMMKQLFADLRRGSGATVISSSSGMQFSYEDSEWQNGAFTYVFLRGLKTMEADANGDGQVTASEIQNYVAEYVPRLTEGLQVPTFRRENLAYDFRVW